VDIAVKTGGSAIVDECFYLDEKKGLFSRLFDIHGSSNVHSNSADGVDCSESECNGCWKAEEGDRGQGSIESKQAGEDDADENEGESNCKLVVLRHAWAEGTACSSLPDLVERHGWVIRLMEGILVFELM
jgi:hypothetical protein